MVWTAAADTARRGTDRTESVAEKGRENDFSSRPKIKAMEVRWEKEGLLNLGTSKARLTRRLGRFGTEFQTKNIRKHNWWSCNQACNVT